MIAYPGFDLVFSVLLAIEKIGWDERFQNGVFRVEWDLHSVDHCQICLSPFVLARET